MVSVLHARAGKAFRAEEPLGRGRGHRLIDVGLERNLAFAHVGLRVAPEFRCWIDVGQAEA